MIRRRRAIREIPFSFDSFLDIVANVVGIIIRLILVVWVGARSYSSVQHTPETTASPSTSSVADLPLPKDPLEEEIARRRQELAAAQARLLEQLRQVDQFQESRRLTERELQSLAERESDLARDLAELEKTADGKRRDASRAALSLDELAERSRALSKEIQDLEKLPPLRKTLRYRTPVSRPVHSEELLFECKFGRVTFIDIGALLLEVRRGMEEKSKALKSTWQISDVTVPVGAFRLRYTVERERGMLEAVGGGSPEASAGFRYGLSEWQLEPMALDRGESLKGALAAKSEFRHIVDSLDPQQTVVTFWVYPDSFDLFRALRDYLYEKDIVVAGRPLPDGFPVASSRRGTVSRGQ